MAQRVNLSPVGLPIKIKVFIAKDPSVDTERPALSQFANLGVFGLPIKKKVFAAKDPEVSVGRPALSQFANLGVFGLPIRKKVFLAKASEVVVVVEGGGGVDAQPIYEEDYRIKHILRDNMEIMELIPMFLEVLENGDT